MVTPKDVEFVTAVIVYLCNSCSNGSEEAVFLSHFELMEDGVPEILINVLSLYCTFLIISKY